MIDKAKSYFKSGINVIALKEDKRPMLTSWKQYQEKRIEPTTTISSARGIGLICGKVSGGLECIDIDLKYDLTGELFDKFKKAVETKSPGLLKKMVVQKTISGGYHFIYRCETISGNIVLAKRPATEEEQSQGERRKVLIETRGEGGYFAAYPTPGYSLIYGQIEKINTITPDERVNLFECARMFNQIYDQKKPERTDFIETDNNTPWGDYNKRGDITEVLESKGWTIAGHDRNKIKWKRPGSTSTAYSAYMFRDNGMFYVHSTSTEFEPEKGYFPFQVYSILEHNGDWQAAARALYRAGYGERLDKKHLTIKDTGETIDLETSEELDFIAQDTDIDTYLSKARTGNLDMGKPFGIGDLDKHFLLKEKAFVIFLGMDNVGKSTLVWYLATVAAIKYNWRWIICSTENDNGPVARKIMEFYKRKKISEMSEAEYKDARSFFKNQFTIISNEKTRTHFEVLQLAEKINKQKKHHGLLIDPWNSLIKDSKATNSFSEHDYDYHITSEIRAFNNRNKMATWLCCHPYTEALRNVYTVKENEDLAGHPKPPRKSDCEGGGKFANRADDFLIIHRLTQHELYWKDTEVYVAKIKDTDTGGMVTFSNNPVKLQFNKNRPGYDTNNPKDIDYIKEAEEIPYNITVGFELADSPF